MMDLFMAVAFIFAIIGGAIGVTGLCTIIHEWYVARKKRKELNDKLSRMNKKVDKIGELLNIKGKAEG